MTGNHVLPDYYVQSIFLKPVFDHITILLSKEEEREEERKKESLKIPSPTTTDNQNTNLISKLFSIIFYYLS